MAIIAKLYFTYCALSMFSGAILMIGDVGEFVPPPSPRLVTFLWMGPVISTAALLMIGGLAGLWSGI